MPQTTERRELRSAFIAPLRNVALQPAGNGEDVIFSGNAVVFNSWSEPLWSRRGYFRERILPGAFDEVLEKADVRLLANHDEASVMARTKSGTLDLTADGEALRVWSRLDPSDPDVQRLQPKVRRRDIDQMSFGFGFEVEEGAEDRWYEDAETKEIRRDIIKVSDLYDVSPVTFPAYLDTSVSLRSMERAVKSGRFPCASVGVNRYERVIQLARETPWAILPSSLATILEMLSLRAQGERLTSEEIRERIGARRERVEVEQGPVAVLPLYGPIFPRANLMTDISGATSVQMFQEQLRQAVNDPEIASILIDIDSPGGLVDLVPELAAEIKEARKVKPIVAHANTLAASAAYWIASAASEIVVTPSGEVGSIGVYAAHSDISGFQEKKGVKTTLVSAGKYKTEANPFEPLSEEALAAIQKDVDEYYRMFVSAVAKGRGVAVADVRNGFGEGRVVGAKEALALGMADRIETFDRTLARLNASYEKRDSTALVIPSRPTVIDKDPQDSFQENSAQFDDLPESVFESRQELRTALGMSAAQAEIDPAGNETDPASAQAEIDPAVGDDQDASTRAEIDPVVGGDDPHISTAPTLDELRERARKSLDKAKADRRKLLQQITK